MSADNTTLSAQVNRLNSADKDQSSPDDAASELVTVVDELLVQLSTKFNNLSGDLIRKMDDMSRRLDVLEANIQATNSNQEGEKGA